MLRYNTGTYQGDAERCRGVKVIPPSEKEYTVISSYGKSVFLGTGSRIIGERINPTGKKRFKQALKEHDLEYYTSGRNRPAGCRSAILDVNVGLPDIDETSMMREVVQELQSVVQPPPSD